METTSTKLYDCAIVGGGLAGLNLSILLARQGRKVIVFEKENYPRHKVCGEYVSMESWPLLQDLGLPLSEWRLPIISKLQVSTPSGFLIHHTLDMGGFGISRFLLDEQLFLLANQNGVEVLQETRVEDVSHQEGLFCLETAKGNFQSKIAVGSWGKRSNIDLKWQRDFALRQKEGLTNYVGVKYHLRTKFPSDSIALHNFQGGYCGISKVENERYCLCYMTTAQNLQKHGDIAQLERNVLWQNPHLKHYFNESEFLYDKPLAISQISFLPKLSSENGVLMAGDAAGVIAPLCGNGMSMALRSAKILSLLLQAHYESGTPLHELEKQYTKKWQSAFGKRLLAGRLVQQTFGKKWLTEMFVRGLSPFPFVIDNLVKLTHGEKF